MSGFAVLMRWHARNGRLVLIAGLLVGIAFPELAVVVRHYLPHLVALTLGVAALRIGPRAARGSLADFRMSLRLVAIYQVIAPLALVSVFLAFGLHGLFATSLVLMASAPSISGSPNLTVMTGNDPAPALRLLIAGTALVPLTVVPVFLTWPLFGSPLSVAMAAVRLLLLIGGAAGIAFAIRHFFMRDLASDAIAVIDGFSALLMAVLVVGLMSAVGPAIWNEPTRLLATLAFAFAVNFGVQCLAYFVLRRTGERNARVAWSIVAGNRNIALFLAALPASLLDPLLLFIGCYQVPMYLTPILLGRLYRPANPAS